MKRRAAAKAPAGRRLRPRRVLLFCPAAERRKVAKAAVLPVDGVILDLEDGTALGTKAEARAAAVEALAAINFGGRERLVRINPLEGPFGEDDLRAVMGASSLPDALVLPKVEGARPIRRLARLLDRLEARRRIRRDGTAILAIVESAAGIVRLGELAACGGRLEALAFGAEDLIGDVGGVRTPEGREILYARSALALHAAAAGLQAIDTPFVDLADAEGLRAQAREAVALGYAGKLAIHPSQIGPILETFVPSDAEVAAARRLIEEHERRQKSGEGAFALDGRMVDMPMVRAARALLDRARAAGRTNDRG